MTHLDTLIKQKESGEMVLKLMNEENDRTAVAAWRRVVRTINNEMELESKNKVDIQELLAKQAYNKYKVKYIEDKEQESRIEIIGRQIDLVCNKEEFMKKLTLQCFFSGDTV